jgi:hypothetical protein
MNRRLARRIRWLTAASLLGLVASSFSMAVAPATAVASPRQTSGLVQESVSAIPALSASTEASATFSIYNYQSVTADKNLCLGITGDADNKPAVLWTCEGSKDQTWHFGAELGTTGFYELINGLGQCLAVQGGSDEEGADLYGWTCEGTEDQYWTVYDAKCKDTFCPINNYESGYVIGVEGGSDEPGAAIVQWPFEENANNQYWEFR